MGNLDPYKEKHLGKRSAAEKLPFLHHRSLARLPLCRTEAYIFVVNFWSDTYNAFTEDDLPELQKVTSGFAEELAQDLESPAAPSSRSLTSGSDKLFECRG